MTYEDSQIKASLGSNAHKYALENGFDFEKLK